MKKVSFIKLYYYLRNIFYINDSVSSKYNNGIDPRIYYFVLVPECERDPDCLTTEYCEAFNQTCGPPCVKWPCGPNSYGTAINHRCFCRCIEGYTGDPNSPGGCGEYIIN